MGEAGWWNDVDRNWLWPLRQQVLGKTRYLNGSKVFLIWQAGGSIESACLGRVEDKANPSPGGLRFVGHIITVGELLKEGNPAAGNISGMIPRSVMVSGIRSPGVHPAPGG
jgi:hypothetical protein